MQYQYSESARCQSPDTNKNGTLYVEYKALADEEEKVFFGGRLGEYKYYYTDATIAAVLEMCENVYDSSIMIEKTGAIQ